MVCLACSALMLACLLHGLPTCSMGCQRAANRANFERLPPNLFETSIKHHVMLGLIFLRGRKEFTTRFRSFLKYLRFCHSLSLSLKNCVGHANVTKNVQLLNVKAMQSRKQEIAPTCTNLLHNGLPAWGNCCTMACLCAAIAATWGCQCAAIAAPWPANVQRNLTTSNIFRQTTSKPQLNTT